MNIEILIDMTGSISYKHILMIEESIAKIVVSNFYKECSIHINFYNMEEVILRTNIKDTTFKKMLEKIEGKYGGGGNNIPVLLKLIQDQKPDIIFHFSDFFDDYRTVQDKYFPTKTVIQLIEVNDDQEHIRKLLQGLTYTKKYVEGITISDFTQMLKIHELYDNLTKQISDKQLNKPRVKI